MDSRGSHRVLVAGRVTTRPEKNSTDKDMIMQLFGQALGLGTLGLVAGVIGAVIAALATRSQTSTLTSYVQHFAAGLIIAAATLDLLPEALHLGGGWPLIVGFIWGTAFMLNRRALLNRFGHSHAPGDSHAHVEHHDA